MTFTAKVDSNTIIDSLRDLFGNNITTADVRGYCASNGISSYQYFCKRYLTDYKVTRGKWDLTVSEARKQFEKTVTSPSAEPVEERNIVPEKDDTFVKFGSFTDVKSR